MRRAGQPGTHAASVPEFGTWPSTLAPPAMAAAIRSKSTSAASTRPTISSSLGQENGALPVALPVWPFTKKRYTRSLYRYVMIHTGSSTGSLVRPSIRTLTCTLRERPGT